MNAKRDSDEEDTPVERPRMRSPSAILTSWGIVSAWCASKAESRMFTGRVDAHDGLVMRVLDDGAVADETVRPNEDPSAALVRAIGKLR